MRHEPPPPPASHPRGGPGEGRAGGGAGAGAGGAGTNGIVSMATLRKEFWRDVASRPSSGATHKGGNHHPKRPLPIPPAIKTSHPLVPNEPEADPGHHYATNNYGHKREDGNINTNDRIQLPSSSAVETVHRDYLLKQSSTLSSISHDDVPEQAPPPRRRANNNAIQGGSMPPPPPQALYEGSTTGFSYGSVSNGSQGNGGLMGQRKWTVSKLTPAGAEMYVNQLRTLLQEAKEELKKRHRVIDVQKRRLDKAEESRARARALFEELIEKVRVEVEQQEMLQIQLNEANLTVEALQHKVAELQWEGGMEQQGDGSHAMSMRELMAERSLMQEAMARMRAEIQDKEHQAALELQEANSRYTSSQQHVAELMLKLLSLATRLEEEHKAREHDAEELEALRADADRVREVADVAAHICEEKETFLKRLREGVQVLKHGRQGKPKPRVLCVDDKGEMLCCREVGQGAAGGGKEHQIPLEGLQVVVGKISKALQRSPASKDLCFSLVSGASKTPTSQQGHDESPTTANSTVSGASSSSGTTPPSKLGFFRSTGVLGGGGGNKERETLDLELVSESHMTMDEMVAGLRLLSGASSAAGGGGNSSAAAIEAIELLRRGSFAGSVAGSVASSTIRDRQGSVAGGGL